MADFRPETNEMEKVVEIENDAWWADIDQGMRDIFDNVISGQHFWELYNSVVTYCSLKHVREDGKEDLKSFRGHDLYVRVANNCANHVQLIVQKSTTIPDVNLLQFYLDNWQNYQRSIQEITAMFEYLNKCMINREIKQLNKNIHEIDQLALLMWRETMKTLIEERIVSELLKSIEKERFGGNIETEILASVIKSFIPLGLKRESPPCKGDNLSVYKLFFDDRFLATTENFYVRESDELFNENSISQYLLKVTNRFREENDRATNYLHEITLAPVLEICKKFLIEKRLENLFTNYKNMLREEQYHDIPLLCEIISRIPGNIENYHAEFGNQVRDFGISAIEKCGDELLNNPMLYVYTVLHVYKKFSHVLSTFFGNDPGFSEAFDKACEKFVNYNCITRTANSSSAKIPELVAKYCDLMLKKESKSSETVQLEEIVTDIIIVFKYIDDKDIFQKLYSQLLARRLLNNTSVSNDAEESLICKLKLLCGMEYTSKFYQMFKDIGVSKDLNNEFRQFLVNSGNAKDVDFEVQILTAGSWPLQSSCEMSIPPELTTYFQNFKTFYDSKFNGRKLNWLFQLSKGELIANCFKNKHIFQVSTFQMTVLLQFNTADSLSIQHLQEATKIKYELLEQVIRVLLKSKLLMCDDEITKLKPSSVIGLFLEYKNKKQRINLNVPIKLEAKSDHTTTEKFVDKERKLLIQAAICRIMKGEKELQHQQLCVRVIDQLSSLFKPTIINIKKCIDLLVEKDYLERNRGEKDVYKYVM